MRTPNALANGNTIQTRTPSHGRNRASKQEINAVATMMATALATIRSSVEAPADSSCLRYATAIAARTRAATRYVAEKMKTEKARSWCSLNNEVGKGMNAIAPRKTKFQVTKPRDLVFPVLESP